MNNDDIRFINEVEKYLKTAETKKLFTPKIIKGLAGKCSDELQNWGLNIIGKTNLSLKKEELVKLYAIVFRNKIVLTALLELLPPNITKIFMYLIENDFILLQDAEKLYQEKIMIKNRYDLELIPEFYLFNCIKEESYRYYSNYGIDAKKTIFFLPYSVRESLINILNIQQPQMTTIEEIPINDNETLIFEDKNKTIKTVPLLYKLYSAGYLSSNIKSSKLTEKVIKNMFDFTEFYEKETGSSKLCHLRRNLILTPFSSFTSKALSKFFTGEEHLKTYKALFADNIFLTSPLIKEILEHLGCYCILDIDKTKENVQKIINLLPVNKWVSISDLSRYIFSKKMNILSIQQGYIIFSTEKIQNDSNTKDFYSNILIDIPLLKGIIFIFAAFGIFDIAYTHPALESIFNNKNRNYLSPFDGLKYLKLNELGAYTFGIKDHIDIEFPKEEEIKISLNSNAMLISYAGTDPLKELFLNEATVPLSKNKYQLTYKTLFKECYTLKSLELKIDRFKKEITSDLPPNWELFFSNAKKNFQNIKQEENYTIYNIDNTNKELHKLLLHDQYLKKIIIKAENYKILVENSNSSKFKTYLLEKGFFF